MDAHRSQSTRLFLYLLGFFYLLYVPNCASAATGRIECNSLPSKILAHPVNYCVILPPSYDADKTRRFPILYFFHGLGDNEQMFIHAGGFNLVQDLCDRGMDQDVATIMWGEFGRTPRVNGSAGIVSVQYGTLNGTALAGPDYVATNGTLAFADGETSKTFNIAIVPDYITETNETVLLVLSNPTGKTK